MSEVRTIGVHSYIFSGSKWVRIWCGCHETSPRCPAPMTYKRGELKDAKRRKATDADYAKLDSILNE